MALIKELLPLYKIILYFWTVGFALWIVFLYAKYRHPNRTLVPQSSLPTMNITSVELSYLIERKITPKTMVASILELLDLGALRLHLRKDEYVLVRNRSYDEKSLPTSQAYLINFIFENLVTRDTITLSELEASTMDHKSNSDFLLNYQVWKKMALKEALTKQYYEMKPEYPAIMIYRNIGCALAIINFIAWYHFWFGYFILIPAFFLFFIFKHFYKRKPEAEALYYEWISFASYLDTNEPLPKKERQLTYLKYGAVLGKVEKVEEKLNVKNDFASRLYMIMDKLVTRATWFGDRSIFS